MLLCTQQQQKKKNKNKNTHTQHEFLKLSSIKKKKEKRECVYYPFLWLTSIRWRHFLPARLEEEQWCRSRSRSRKRVLESNHAPRRTWLLHFVPSQQANHCHLSLPARAATLQLSEPNSDASPRTLQSDFDHQLRLLRGRSIRR